MLEEQTGVRRLEYSAWHRPRSISRFVGWEQAQLLSLIDIDAVLWLEIDHRDKAPLALIEACCDVGQPYKPATAIMRLARRAKLPAYVVMYKPSAEPNPAFPHCRDLASVKVRRLYPRMETRWRELTPAAWASALCQIRAWSAARTVAVEAANDAIYFAAGDDASK